jgi:hypothetical protein
MLELIDLSDGPTPALCEVWQCVSKPVIQNNEFQSKVLIPILPYLWVS